MSVNPSEMWQLWPQKDEIMIFRIRVFFQKKVVCRTLYNYFNFEDAQICFFCFFFRLPEHMFQHLNMTADSWNIVPAYAVAV